MNLNTFQKYPLKNYNSYINYIKQFFKLPNKLIIKEHVHTSVTCQRSIQPCAASQRKKIYQRWPDRGEGFTKY